MTNVFRSGVSKRTASERHGFDVVNVMVEERVSEP